MLSRLLEDFEMNVFFLLLVSVVLIDEIVEFMNRLLNKTHFLHFLKLKLSSVINSFSSYFNYFPVL